MVNEVFPIAYISYITDIVNENFPDYSITLLCKPEYDDISYMIDKDERKIVLYFNEKISIVELHKLMLKMREICYDR